MENTEHYNLNLPEGDDIYNVRDFNHNSIILDNLVYASNENIQVIQGDIHDVKEDINGIESDINDIEDEIQDMKTTFQAGVDACYDACYDKGSTPVSHALADVVDAIYNIGGGTVANMYSMFPQEVVGRTLYNGGCYPFSEIHLYNDFDICVGHLYILSNNQIKFNFFSYMFYIECEEPVPITFSLVIDNTTVIPNIATYIYDPNEESYNYDSYSREFSFSYTLQNSLSIGYHIISLRSNFPDDYYPGLFWPMFNFYGSNFVAESYPGAFLDDARFIHFTPNNFVVPTNPTQYTLVEGTPGQGNFEDVASAMNDHFSSTFDNGTSYQMEATTPYMYMVDLKWQYIYPDIEDTFTYNNGKITYLHSVVGEHTTYEYHNFIIPIDGTFFKFCKYIHVHFRMIASSESGSGTEQGDGQLKIMVLNRKAVDEVDFSYNSKHDPGTASLYQYYYSYDDDKGDDGVISLNVADVNENDISFIVIKNDRVLAQKSPFAFEIDRIWGTNDIWQND